MAKLIILRGLPASGKSTRAREIIKADGNTVRVNKDLLREMLHFNHWSGKNEQKTSSAAIGLVTYLLTIQKCNVIVDDTNLNPKTLDAWVALGNTLGAKIEIVDLTDVSILTCITRDTEREYRKDRFVGRSVIVNMARQWGLYSFDKPDVICDIDGTLAEISHRLHYVKGEKKDWKGFYSEMSKDKLRTDVYDVVEKYAVDNTIVLVSGRPEDYRTETERWLAKHFIDYETLIMRPKGDSRDDTIIKKEILDKYFKRDNIRIAIDDRPRVIRMWEANGIPVMDVGSGVEF